MEKHEKKIEVEVAYTGHDEFKGTFPPEDTVGTVKRKAMDKFGIEPSAADQYVLQHAGVNVDDGRDIDDFGKHEVKFVLLLKKPQEKGYGG